MTGEGLLPSVTSLETAAAAIPVAEGAAVTPSKAKASGPSYSPSIKAMALIIVAALILGLARLSVQTGTSLPPVLTGLAVVGMLIVIAACWGMLTSQTSIDDHQIRQTAPWPRVVTIANITSCQLVHLPLLSWLIAPRLLVRSIGGLGVVTIHSADAGVLRAFGELAGAGQGPLPATETTSASKRSAEPATGPNAPPPLARSTLR
jgi:hypothetical protein